jgi:hypothetical protein
MMQAICQTPMTVRELADNTGISEGRVRYSLSRWHAQGEVRIASWARVLCPDGKYRVTPQFLGQCGYDEPPPEGVTRKGLVLRLEPSAHAVTDAINTWFRSPK